MRTRTASLLGLLGVCPAACSSGDDFNAGADTTSSTETGGESFACGDIDCAADQACLTFGQQPMCENKQDDQPCPEGTTETLCGGAGIPCCCGPTPASIYQCTATTECGEIVDCGCLAEVCTPQCWATADAKVFICEEGPAP
jgi:hypothetical protein